MKHKTIAMRMLCILLCIALFPMVKAKATSHRDVCNILITIAKHGHIAPSFLDGEDNAVTPYQGLSRKFGEAVVAESRDSAPEPTAETAEVDKDAETPAADSEKTESTMHVLFIVMGALAAVLIIIFRRKKRMK